MALMHIRDQLSNAIRKVWMANIGTVEDEELVQGVQLVDTDGVPQDLGAEGTSPPSIAGRGVLGYLREILSALLGTLNVLLRDGDGDPITDNANNALRVNVVAGSLGADTVYSADTESYIPSGMSTTAYTSGDVMGAVRQVTGKMRGTNPHAYINQVAILTGAGDSTFAARLHVFNDNPNNTTFTDNAGITIAANDRTKYVGAINMVRQAVGGVGVLVPDVNQLPLACVHATNTNFWVVIECRGAVTLPDVNNLRVTLMLGY